jgi:hypothetical protein
MRAGHRVDQLPGNTDPIATLAHRAFEHITDAQLAADLLHVNRLTLVRKTRIAGDDEQPADTGERGDDLLDHAVDEIFLLRVAAHIGEGQNCNRRLVRQRQRRGHRRFRAEANPVDMHRPSDVLDLLFTDVPEGDIELISHLVVHHPADADAARLRERFETGGNVHAVAKDVAPVPDDVAEVDPNAELDAAVWRHIGVSIRDLTLHFHGAAHRVDDAGKLKEQPVAGGFDDAAAVLLDLGIGHLAPKSFQRGEGAFLVRSHQPRIARDIGGEDRGEPAGLAHVASPAARRRPERKSSRCSWLRKWSVLGMIVGVMERSRATISLASSSRPIWA